MQATISKIYASESRRVLATLIRLLGDFDLAEEAMHDAFAVALIQWQHDGLPDNPRAWLVSTGRFKAIDKLRRRARFDQALVEIANQLELDQSANGFVAEQEIEDDMLRLIFTCCHPALSADSSVALTLREVCGLTTEAIAHAFLTTPSTIAQRIVRAKAKIRSAGIPYELPSRKQLPERLDGVLHVIYLVFNEGYFASSGESLTRTSLSNEAIRLGRQLANLLPEAEVMGLLALMLLHEARRDSRTTASGDIVMLEMQNRQLWNRDFIEEGSALVSSALRSGRAGVYALQAAIAAIHAEAPRAQDTDWHEIVGLYDLLLSENPSPIIELNRAAAVAMRDGSSAGLELIDSLWQRGELLDYALAHAASADLYRRLGENSKARAAFKKAIELSKQAPERRLLEMRLAELPE